MTTTVRMTPDGRSAMLDALTVTCPQDGVLLRPIDVYITGTAGDAHARFVTYCGLCAESGRFAVQDHRAPVTADQIRAWVTGGVPVDRNGRTIGDPLGGAR